VVSTTDIEFALRHSAERIVAHARLLLNAAVAASDKEQVQRLEAALLTGAPPELRITLQPRGNALLTLAIGEVEIFRGQGASPQGEPTALN
jgi:hypothetical protein